MTLETFWIAYTATGVIFILWLMGTHEMGDTIYLSGNRRWSFKRMAKQFPLTPLRILSYALASQVWFISFLYILAGDHNE